MPIVTTGFAGTVPRTSAKLLQNNQSQTALNCRLTSGDLEPWRSTSTVGTFTKGSGVKSFYRVPYNGTDYWFNWLSETEVVQSPVVTDTHKRIYFTTGGNAYVCRRQDQVAQADFPANYYLLGVTAPDTAPVITPSGGTVSTSTTRAYVYTFVSQWGEESGPSPAAEAVGNSDGTWDVSGILTCANALSEVPVTARRLYRTATASDGTTAYQLVTEIEDNVTTTYSDTVPDLLLGETLPTVSYTPPPRGSTYGLTLMGNGIVALFDGKDVWFSEPYKPHAWPIDYIKTVEFDIVGLGAIGNALVVATTGDPTLMTGADPAGITEQKLDVNQPCLSRRSIVPIGDAVAYASADGIVIVNVGQATLATRNLYTREEWADLNVGSTMFACRYDQGYLFNTNTDSVLWWPQEQLGMLTSFSYDDMPTASYSDYETNAVYFAIGSSITAFNADITTNLTYLYKSRIYTAQKPVNYGWAKIDSNAGTPASSLDLPGGPDDVIDEGGINELAMNGYVSTVAATSPALTFKLYADDVLKHTQVVTGTNPFRLPSGFKAEHWHYELIGNSEVHAVYVTETMQELKSIGV